MCSRYAYAIHPQQLRLDFCVESVPDNLTPNYNIAPTQFAAVVLQQGGVRSLALLRWGLRPAWARGAMAQALTNARCETVAAKPSFREAFRLRRCIVPASGWYEWRAGPDGRQPYYIHPADGEPLALAGLHESALDPSSPQGRLRTFAIITTAAAPRLAWLHERMPALLDAAGMQSWLDHGASSAGAPTHRALQELLIPNATRELRAMPVGRAVGNVRSQGRELIEPVGPDYAPGADSRAGGLFT